MVYGCKDTIIFHLTISYGGFYLFAFWSPKQTEPINLPDNRCLTIGLRVQRYDYFSFDNKLWWVLFIRFLVIQTDRTH